MLILYAAITKQGPTVRQPNMKSPLSGLVFLPPLTLPTVKALSLCVGTIPTPSHRFDQICLDNGSRHEAQYSCALLGCVMSGAPTRTPVSADMLAGAEGRYLHWWCGHGQSQPCSLLTLVCVGGWLQWDASGWLGWLSRCITSIPPRVCQAVETRGMGNLLQC